jgi:hypothetical protein
MGGVDDMMSGVYDDHRKSKSMWKRITINIISLGKFRFLRIVPVKYVLAVSNLLAKIRDVKSCHKIRGATSLASRILLIISLPRGYLVFHHLGLGHIVFLYTDIVRNERLLSCNIQHGFGS